MSNSDWIHPMESVQLPARENAMSRRYLAMLHGWIPLAMRYFKDWPVRPNCGHFFGGVHWYGQETAQTMTALAAAASSPEYDAARTGVSADELRGACLKGLRYLCFTHDTGPADCVRPAKGLGRPENAAAKWGERGKGFFRESQCGGTIGGMVRTAVFLRELLDDETWEMLATVAADYVARFENLPPRSGVYDNTQTEENSWTAHGLLCGALFLSRHPSAAAWEEHARRWMFCVTTRPEDRYDQGVLADGKTINGVCGRIYTTLPDGLAENHGFVHPSYMGSAIAGLGQMAFLYHLFGQTPPPHLFWRRQDSYDILKSMSDAVGAPHAVQGMDWPYSPHQCLTHAFANVYLHDADAALLERRALACSERVLAAQGGRMVREDVAKYCHGPQDPAIMRERACALFASAYVAHRLDGEGQEPVSEEAFESRYRGVRVFPHGGTLFHRHARGQTAFSWRNHTMVLPLTRDGMTFVSPATDSLLAAVAVKDRPGSTTLVSMRIRESKESAVAALVQDVAQRSVRRQVLFAALPDGDCLLAERLVAREDIAVESVDQGFLRIRNDDVSWPDSGGRGRRRLFHAGGEETFLGFVSPSAADDVIFRLNDPGWVNVDDRLGLVFQGTGETIYHSRHYFDVFRALADDLFLSVQREPHEYREGERIAQLALRTCPGQTHGQTARSRLHVACPAEHVVCLATDGALAAANFGDQSFAGEVALPIHERQPEIAIYPGTNSIRKGEVRCHLCLGPGDALLRQAAGSISVPEAGAADLLVDVTERGTAYVTNRGKSGVRLNIRIGDRVTDVALGPDQLRCV